MGSDEQSKIRIYPFFLFTHVALMRRMMMMTTLELGISFIIVFILEALHQTYNRTKSFNIHVSIPSSHSDTKGCREREWEVGWVLSQSENQSKWIKEKRAKKSGNADAVLLSLFFANTKTLHEIFRVYKGIGLKTTHKHRRKAVVLWHHSF